MNMLLKGHICFSKTAQELKTLENGWVVCENGVSKGVFTEIPDRYSTFPVFDYGDNIIIPGLCDLHVHAPQYAIRGLGLDLELLDWLNTYVYAIESKYAQLDYAVKPYESFVNDLTRGATTRAAVFATMHLSSTVLLMEMLEKSGLVTFVGKVSMDRNSPDYLREENAQTAYDSAKSWIDRTICFENTKPIITPRFIPACSDELMSKLKELQMEYKLPVQSHLSENKREIEWVRELCPDVESYAEAYNQFGLFGGEGTPAIMAHCIWSAGSEEKLLKDNNVYVAHCPQSNMNLSSGIAPIRRFMRNGIKAGLGSDIAGGCHLSVFRAMSDAIQASKLYWRLIDQNDAPLTIPEAFYLGTVGGGSFFGKAGSFDDGFEFDAIVIDDKEINPYPRPIEDRLAGIIYLSDERCIRDKYVRGRRISDLKSVSGIGNERIK